MTSVIVRFFHWISIEKLFLHLFLSLQDLIFSFSLHEFCFDPVSLTKPWGHPRSEQLRLCSRFAREFHFCAPIFRFVPDVILSAVLFSMPALDFGFSHHLVCTGFFNWPFSCRSKDFSSARSCFPWYRRPPHFVPLRPICCHPFFSWIWVRAAVSGLCSAFSFSPGIW
jgi:hypothetical protein